MLKLSVEPMARDPSPIPMPSAHSLLLGVRAIEGGSKYFLQYISKFFFMTSDFIAAHNFELDSQSLSPVR